MSVDVIVAQAGPLPITVTFNAPGNEPMYLEVNGSVWTHIPNTLTGIVVELDGTVIGEANIYSKADETHRAVVPAFIKVQFQEVQHTLTLSAAGKTESDHNDFYTAVLHL